MTIITVVIKQRRDRSKKRKMIGVRVLIGPKAVKCIACFEKYKNYNLLPISSRVLNSKLKTLLFKNRSLSPPSLPLHPSLFLFLAPSSLVAYPTDLEPDLETIFLRPSIEYVFIKLL